MAQIDSLFMTKTAEKPCLWGRMYLYSPYKGVPHPPGGGTKTRAFLDNCTEYKFDANIILV